MQNRKSAQHRGQMKFEKNLSLQIRFGVILVSSGERKQAFFTMFINVNG